MGTIAENLQILVDCKADIKAAIEEKEIAVGESALSTYGDKIRRISQVSVGLLDRWVSNNGYPFVVEGLLSMFEQGEIANNDPTYTWGQLIGDETFTGREGALFIRPNYPITVPVTSSLRQRGSLFYIGGMCDFSLIVDGYQYFRYNVRMIRCDIRDFPAMTTARAMFQKCNRLLIGDINLPVVTNIQETYANCNNIEMVSMNLPANVPLHAIALFSECYKLRIINFTSSNNNEIMLWNNNPATDTGQLSHVFRDNNKLNTINGIINVSECKYGFLFVFYRCYELVSVRIKGICSTSGGNGLYLQHCRNLDTDSIIYLLNNTLPIVETSPSTTLPLHTSRQALLNTPEGMAAIAAAVANGFTITFTT